MKRLLEFKKIKFNSMLKIILFGFGIVSLIMILKLIELQLIDPKQLKEEASKMRMKKEQSYRGEIFDRNGLKLATNGVVYDVYAHPQDYNKDEDGVENLVRLLSPILNIQPDELKKQLSKNYSVISLAKGIDRETMLKLKKLELMSISIDQRNVRVYPQGDLASHILGYVNPGANVSAGVENTGSKFVEKVKSKIMQKDGHGKIIFDFGVNPEDVAKPNKGDKLVLTIDSAIQHVAEKELAKMMEDTDAEKGTVIVMTPKNGEILAMAVAPSYNPNEYAKYDYSVVKNWVLTDVYPPGSTFKILTVASALNTGKMSKYDTVLDTGTIKIQGWTISNYDVARFPHPGNIDLPYLLEHSSNVGSVKVAFKMTPSEFHNQLALFGIGSKTGIDLPGESSGVMHPVSSWDQSMQATISFGYSIAATPMQMASAVASIANNGVWITPHVIKYDEETAKTKIQKRQVLSPQTARDMTELLEHSIRHSKSVAGKIPNFTVAGKTGTSRKPNPHGGGYLQGVVYTSFAAFFPSTNPEVLIMVVVDSPKGGEVWGSTVAGPVFNEVASFVTRHLNLQPDAPGLNVKNN